MSSYPTIKHDDIAVAIRAVQAECIWKPGSAEYHLAKRISRGHLPVGTDMATYESLIHAIASQETAHVYIFWYDNTPYVGVVEQIAEAHWLVLFALDGTLESAFMVEKPERYLQRNYIVLVGSLKVVMSS